jgi:hypothetical protein
MSSRNTRQWSGGTIFIAIILLIIAFLLLPEWLQTLITVIAIIAIIEAFSRIAFDGFSPIRWILKKIFNT